MSPRQVPAITDESKTREQLLSELQELRTLMATLVEAEDRSQRIAEALRESEERFNFALKAAQEGIWDWNMETNEVYYSSRYKEMLGYSEEEIEPKASAWVRLMHPDDRERALKVVDSVMHGERGYEMEFRMLHKDGHYVDILSRGYPIRSKAGSPVTRIVGTHMDITERNRMADELRRARDELEVRVRERTAELSKSEAKYRTIVETANEGIWMIGLDARTTFVNDRMARMLGYTPGEMLGKKIGDFMDDSEKARTELELDGHLKGAKLQHDSRLRRKDGSYLWFIVSATPILDENGRITGGIGMITDITERKRAEEVVNRLRANMEKSQEIAHLGSWELDLLDNKLLWSDEVYRIFGLQPQEFSVTYDAFLDAIHPEDRAMVDAAYTGSIRDGRDTYDIEHRVVRRSTGEIRFVHEKCEHIRDRSGKIVRSVGMVLDITERKQDDAELERLNRAYRAISLCNEAMIHARNEDVLLQDICNIVVEEGGYRMAWIGYAMDDEGKTVRPMARTGYGEEYIEKARVTWADSERGRGPTGTAVRMKRPSVIRNVREDLSFSPWRADAVKMGYASVLGLPLIADQRAFGVLTIYSDKTDVFDEEEIVLLEEMANNLAYGIMSLRNRSDRKQAEIKLREAKQQAELYLDLMGHDINNIHQAAMGYLELARDMPDDKGELLNQAMEALKRSTQLIGNVRKLQNLGDEHHLQEMDVCSVLKRVYDEHANISGKTITLSLNGHARCHVLADDLLHDVFSNLVGNAVKHTGDSARISISLDTVHEEGCEHFRVAVNDDGLGIPDDIKKMLFNRSLKGTPRAKGMGIGLYIVKMLVENYGGRVWVEDRIKGDHSKGARFVVMLPALEK